MEDKIEQLRRIISVPEQQARYYLEAAGGDVDLAAGIFDEQNMFQSQSPQPAIAQPAPQPAQPQYLPKNVPSKPTPSGVRGFSDFVEEDEDDKKRDAFYAGGQKSGVQILDPNKKPDIKNVFDTALTHGASHYQPEKQEKFSGSGFVLGNTAETKVIPSHKPPELKRVILTFWKDGFTVDNGPLRKYEDPQNRQFIDSVNKGQVPLELGREDLNFELIDKKIEEYKPPPKPKIVAFSGSGQSLGGTIGGGSMVAAKVIQIDESKPTTSIQVRLADGSRLVVKLNCFHTIGDLKSHIEASKPSNNPFVLSLSYPPKSLTDDNETIEAAGLKNASVVQRFA